MTSVVPQWRGRLTELLDNRRRRPRPATSAERFAAAVAFQSELVDAGLAAPGWPAAAGGMELDLEDQLDYYRMMTSAGAPRHPCAMSMIVAPTLIVHGTEAQRQRYLEPLLRADEFWCQGFSEPGAGSDLASISTRATRDGDVYRVSGQKIWTTMADRADWMFALVRTGDPGRGTAGITYLLIAMDSPGIEVRPLRDAAGGHHFAEVFFDDVAVPTANRVGEEGAGWSIMRTSLGHERATAFLADEFRYRKTVDKVFRLAIDQGQADDPLIRQSLAELETDVRTIASNSARALDAVLRGEDPGGVASVNRLVKSEFEQRLHRLALRLTGSGAILAGRSTGAVDGGRWTYGYLMSRAATIGAGTAEIQRNTIAESVLGLPSHRGEGRRAPAVQPGRPLAPPTGDESAVREAVADTVDHHVATPQASPVEGVRQRLWADLVAFGLPGLAIPERLGGGGAGMRLLCAAVEEAAHRLAPASLVPTIGALAVLAAAGADDDVRTVAGGAQAAVAARTGDAGWTVGESHGVTFADGALNGTVQRVPGAGTAEIFVVLAWDSVAHEPAVLVVDRSMIEVDEQDCVDLTATVGTVHLDGVAGRVVAQGDSARRAVENARRAAQLVLAADSVGVATRAVASATEWAGQREQFGRPVGSFQAVSHRCADMLVDAESARNQVLSAADLLDAATASTGGPGGDGPGGELPDTEVSATVDLAVAQALSAAVRVCEACMQIHGGIGFTWEHHAHLLLRRAIANEAAMSRPEVLRSGAVGALLSR